MHHPNLVDLPETDDRPRRFEANAALTYQLLAVGLVLLAAGVVAFWYWQHGRLQGKMAALPFLLLPAGVVLTGLQLWNLLAPLRVVLTPDGFEARGEAYPWDEVAAVGEQLNPNEPLNGLTVWVRHANGRTARLSAARLAELPLLLAVIHRHTLPRLLAEARAALERGEAVPFGPIELTADGLRAGRRVLPWAELERVTPDGEGDLGVWAVGRRKPWLDVATGKVGNVRVLLQLVEEYAPSPGSADRTR
jgi:hypothetical protein